MAKDEFTIPTHVRNAISKAGYSCDQAMDDHIARWWSWYTTTDDFYSIKYVTKDGHKKSRRRLSLRPARKVCREMASLILTEDTQVSVEADGANEWLQGYLDSNNFWPTGQLIVEKAFALGTGAWALWFDVGLEATRIKVRRYDARMIVPLSWDEEGVTECAFVTRVTIKGQKADQLQMHVMDPETATYHVVTKVWVKGQEVSSDDILADFDTKSRRKTFGIIKPALENTVCDLSPYGMSVFEDAMDAVRSVDLTYDAMMQEIALTEVRVFMDDALIDVRSEDGRVIPVASTDEQLYRKLAGQGAKDLIDVFSPNIRVDSIRGAFNVALAELGDQCGFGTQYFALDKSGGLKTATEVVSDNSTLMRSIRKHENVIRGAVQDIVGALIDCARIHCGAPIEEDFGAISVEFDDSVITDTQTEKNLALSEITMLGVPELKRRYLKRYCGFSEEEADAAVPDGAMAVNEGY